MLHWEIINRFIMKKIEKRELNTANLRNDEGKSRGKTFQFYFSNS